MNKRIMCITDSVAMPRNTVNYTETWIYMLQKRMAKAHFINRSMRGSTVYRLIQEGGGGLDLLETYKPDLVILQLGITDCAPRLFRKNGLEYRVLNTIVPRGLRMKYVQYVKRKRGRNPRYTETSPDTFKAILEQYVRRAALLDTRVVYIAIAPPSTSLLEKSPYAGKNIERYNAIAKNLLGVYTKADFINPYEGIDLIDSIFTDEIHLNKKGMELVYHSVIDTIIPTEEFVL